ncbi:MAG: glycosyltransferase [Clostridia bacterium]|nr:glycosyltransferase [Clostridia bacterium]
MPEKKKILFAAYSLDVGGIETALVSLLNYLSKKYDITLVLEKKQGIFLDQIDKSIKIIEYTPSYFKFKLVAKAINLFKRLMFTLNYKNKFDFACSYATYCKMASFVARTASQNTALWVHNNYYYFFNRNDYKYKEFFDSIKSHEFKHVLFVSEEAKNQYIEKYGVGNEQLLTCNNLIDYAKITRLAEDDIIIKRDNSVITFINVARHDEHQKRITRLIDCAKLLKKDNKQFRIILVGSGADTEGYKRLVDNNDLSENIIFAGKQANPYPYFEISDCVILTSDYEGYPVTYIEAKVLNKPIITTDVSDSKKDIANKFGFVTEKNTMSIYEAMKDFIDNGYQIKENFAPDEYNEDIVKKVEKIING